MSEKNLPAVAPIVLAPAPTLREYCTNLQEQAQVADIMFKSGLAPKHFSSPSAVLTAVWYGSELGFSPIQAIQSIDIIEGRAGINAAGLQALCISKGGQFRTITSDASTCTVEGKRGDQVERITFTMEDAKRAGIAGKNNWQKWPKEMLFARAVSRVIRKLFADVIRGLHSSEELRDGFSVEEPLLPSPEPEQPSPVVPEPHYYRIKSDWTDAQKAAAPKLLEKAGGHYDDVLQAWVCRDAVPKLKNAEVSFADLETELNARNEIEDVPTESYTQEDMNYDFPQE